MADELSSIEKGALLGIVDEKERDHYDQGFYDTMCQTEPPDIDEVDGEVRRAISRFVMEKDKNPLTGGFFTFGFLSGYMVALKLKRDIRGKK